ncbi:MAG: methylmalonate-semialdehyde dehydrogenase (CoA acylating), partial [Burkholderiales bacterium]
MSIKSIDHYIAGTTVGAEAGKVQDVFNPATGAVSGRVALGGKTEVDRAVAAAEK